MKSIITEAQYKALRKFLIIGSLALVGLILFWKFNFFRFFTTSFAQRRVAYLEQLITYNYWAAVRAYFLLCMITVIIGIPITGIFAMAAGYMFGVFLGTAYTVLASVAGSVIVVLSIRYFLSHWLKGKYAERLETFNERMAKYGYGYLIVLHLLTIVPFFLINTLAALSGISIFAVVWTTIVGSTIPYLLYVLMSTELKAIATPGDMLKPQIIIVFLLIGLLMVTPLILRRLRGTVKF